MLVITGAAGFIASCLVSELNRKGRTDLVLVDDFSIENKKRNIENKKYVNCIDRNSFESWFLQNADKVKFVFHIGARTDTTEFNWEILETLNLNYTKMIWNMCVKHNIPLVYASSAATYGLGEFGYSDKDKTLSDKLKPLNAYGVSKNEFDKWALLQNAQPPKWYGLKFFNVYGPNEFHKGRMASVIFHAYNQIKDRGSMKLFRSHHKDYSDGGQLRDFIYVKDVVQVILYLFEKNPANGIYNLGTGKARTFLDLAKGTFKALNKTEEITFIDTPEDIRDKYQYYTQADMSKLIESGYDKPFYSLEEGINDYVTNYLIPNKTL
jgi:ADP-L-glycero-D-manno-heptose 6-epimerase